MSDNYLAVRSGSLSVDDSLGNTLSGEVGKLVKEMEVLDEDGAVGANSEGVIVVVDRMSLGVCDGGSLHCSII